MIGRSQDAGAPVLVLLTATITPPEGVPALARTDPATRLDDYLAALAFYLSLPTAAIDRIVFAENSASDLGPIEELVGRLGAGKEIELLSFHGLDYPVEHGRAVGEMRLVETALGRSRLLGALGPAEPFWKITGRLRVTNLDRLVATAPPEATLYADFRRIPHPWVDLRAFACTVPGFRDLFVPRIALMRQNELEEAGYSAPEERLFEELLGERPEVAIVPRLRVEPRIEGYSGFDDDLARPSRRLWSRARGAARRLFPWLWI